MLMPAAVLVMLLLAALAVDTSVVWLGQRELANAAGAAANDIAAVAIDDAAFYADGEVTLDRAVARRIVADHVRAATDEPLDHVEVERVTVTGRRVEVHLRARVRPVIGAPGLVPARHVRAVAVATAEH